MAEPRRPISIEDLYGDCGMTDDQIDRVLGRSLDPRPPDSLYARFGALGVARGHVVLDAGCRDARHSCELARRFECRVVAIDPVAHNVEGALRRVDESRMAGAVRVVEGRLESLPCEDRSIDFIWCRDVLNHVPDLGAALRECARVLKPGGAMLAYQTFATDLLEPREAERLFDALATVAANMSRDHFEAAARSAGLGVVERDEIGSEWREHLEETGRHDTSRQLLTIARMRRARERLVTELGPTLYETELANCHWGVFQMLGKLCPTVYVLQNDREHRAPPGSPGHEATENPV